MSKLVYLKNITFKALLNDVNEMSMNVLLTQTKVFNHCSNDFCAIFC